MTEAENMEVARQLAAQAWCELETEMIEMDVRLAEAFAKRIAALNTTIENLRASHDLPRLQDVAEINALRTRLAESEGEVAGLTRAWEEISAEREASANLATAQRDRAKAAERVLESERGVVIACTRRAEKAEAERDDLLGALREIGALLYAQALYGTEGHAKVVEAHSRARAAIAKVGGK